MGTAALIALISVAGGLGLLGMIFLFVGKMVKGHNEMAKIKMQKEILELEIQKQNNQIKLLEEESKKYDKIINDHQ